MCCWSGEHDWARSPKIGLTIKRLSSARQGMARTKGAVQVYNDRQIWIAYLSGVISAS